jgi:hypothetical protein
MPIFTITGRASGESSASISARAAFSEGAATWMLIA